MGTVAEHNALIQRLYDRLLSAGDESVVSDVIDDDVAMHAPALGTTLHGHDGFLGYIRMMRTTFPDMHVTIDDIFGEGDRTAIRARVVGTHLGEFQGVAPTGKRVEMTENLIARWEDGKVREIWHQFDAVAGLQQMGVIPPPGSGPLTMIGLFVKGMARGTAYELRKRRGRG